MKPYQKTNFLRVEEKKVEPVVEKKIEEPKPTEEPKPIKKSTSKRKDKPSFIFEGESFSSEDDMVDSIQD